MEKMSYQLQYGALHPTLTPPTLKRFCRFAILTKFIWGLVTNGNSSSSTGSGEWKLRSDMLTAAYTSTDGCERWVTVDESPLNTPTAASSMLSKIHKYLLLPQPRQSEAINVNSVGFCGVFTTSSCGQGKHIALSPECQTNWAYLQTCSEHTVHMWLCIIFNN